MGTIPVRPAAYVRDLYADPGDESGLAESGLMMVRLAREAARPLRPRRQLAQRLETR
jgi:hypothetical protein